VRPDLPLHLHLVDQEIRRGTLVCSSSATLRVFRLSSWIFFLLTSNHIILSRLSLCVITPLPRTGILKLGYRRVHFACISRVFSVRVACISSGFPNLILMNPCLQAYRNEHSIHAIYAIQAFTGPICSLKLVLQCMTTVAARVSMSLHSCIFSTNHALCILTVNHVHPNSIHPNSSLVKSCDPDPIDLIYPILLPSNSTFTPTTHGIRHHHPSPRR
jgi:hypothetical protein